MIKKELKVIKMIGNCKKCDDLSNFLNIHNDVPFIHSLVGNPYLTMQ